MQSNEPYIILRLKNERDQRFVKNTMENWDDEVARQLPNFAIDRVLFPVKLPIFH